MIFINLLILIMFIVLFIRTKSYEKDFVATLDEERYKLKQIFPLGLYIVDSLKRIEKHFNFSKQEGSLKAIYVGEHIQVVKRLYLCNKIVMALLIIFAFNILSIFSYINAANSGNLQENYIINRPVTSSQMNTISLDVYMTQEDLLVLAKEIDLEIQGRKYTEEELSKLIINAKEYIDSNILQDNRSFKEIYTNIKLVSHIPDTELYVDWEIGDYDFISSEGKINNESLETEVDTWVKAIITYEDIKVDYKIDLTLYPKKFTQEELAYRQLLEALEKADNITDSENVLELPSEVNGMEVYWKEKEDTSSSILFLMGIIVAVVIFIAYDQELYDKVEERNRQMLLDYPEIINKTTLLLGAGMPLKNAWHKIVEDYKIQNTKKRYAYEEMLITSNELMIGTSEITAYEGFGRRVKLLPYLKFSSLIGQNVKKGSADLLSILEVEALEALEERKELAKRIGEEAGTKLLLPMMLMLLIVLVIVIVPAFLSFQI